MSNVYHCVVYRPGGQNLSTFLCPCVKGMLAAWVFDECDATGQQRTSAVYSAGHSGQDQQPVEGPLMHMCLWLPHLCKQERLERLASALCWLLYCMRPVCQGRLCVLHFGICRPTLHTHLNITGKLMRGNTPVPPQLEHIKICLFEGFGCFTVLKIRF